MLELRAMITEAAPGAVYYTREQLIDSGLHVRRKMDVDCRPLPELHAFSVVSSMAIYMQFLSSFLLASLLRPSVTRSNVSCLQLVQVSAKTWVDFFKEMDVTFFSFSQVQQCAASIWLI